ncbi:hypothetical protein DEM27_00180 [Metarhizobium album]|uniref:Bacteriophage tail tape measure N-terminal domain-containing protein n=1 Tax=Metarhizobium album TaxID=2182425 RepID=A0A2U2DWI3_9HYPH|nr:phage tail length tape measure family protein [Rhizobium album]PWE57666.1 hypothetical protein DEM27_00180 [Rhizobium album]
MTQAVTELIVRDGGSLAVLDRFETGMQAAGAASEKSTGAIDRYNAAMTKFAEAERKGAAFTTQRVERLTAEQRAMERWQAKLDQGAALEIKLRREAERAAVDAANAVALGYTTQEQALRTLMALEKSHAGQLAQISNVARSGATVANDAIRSRIAATNDLTQATNRLAVANDNASNTANLAAQFQDIGVTAAMGMSPLQIALQQGTQISAVLGPMGAAGAVRSLGAAFASIVSPVSLVTIGLVAVAAAAIQWVSSSKDGAEDAGKALEEHKKWLDALLSGYESVQKAARAASDEAARLPQGVVEIDLAAGLKRQAEEAEALDQRIRAARESAQQLFSDLNSPSAPVAFGINEGPGLDDLRQQAAFIRDLGLSASSSAKELDDAMIAARALFEATDDMSVKDAADSVFNLARELHALRARMEETKAAQDALANTSGVAEALERVRDRTVDLRTEKEKLDDQFRTDAMGARTIGDLNALVSAYASMERAAQASAWAVANSGDAAKVAASQYGTAAGAAGAYANALWKLGSIIPEVAAAQTAMLGLRDADESLNKARTEAANLLQAGAITQDDYNKKLDEASSLYRRAKEEITGFSSAESSLQKKERAAAIGAMDERAAAAARIRDEYADLEKEIRKSITNGQSEADVNLQLQRATAAMNSELDASTKHFDDIAAKAGERGAAKDVRDAAKAAREAERDFRSFANDADRLVEQMFPGEAARREAEELLSLMKQFGGQLDELQAKAVNTEIQNLFKASEMGVRRLGDRTESRMAEAAEAVEGTLGSVLSDLFSEPTRGLDAFVDKMISAFAQLGQANLQKAFDGLLGGGGSSAGRSGQSAGNIFSGLKDAVSSLFGTGMTKSSSFVSTQSRAVADAAARVSTRPVTNVLSDLGSSIKKTATDLGVSARDIAAIIGYETGGTYNAWQKGPTSKWGEHRGLIQWGEPQRRQYGVTAQSTVAEQMEAVTRYLKNAGVEPGMGLKDLYSAVNAGRVGLYNRIDGATTVMQKVANDIPKHYASADRLLGTAPDMKSAVADGTKNALTAVASARVGAGAGDGFNIVAGQPGGTAGASLGGAGLGGALNAALGGFGLGAQTENPAMGALGGAISGFSAGGLPGAIIGGIAGFIGGLFGKSRAKKKEQAQARNELNSNKTAIEAIFATGEGRGIGSATQAYNEFYDKTAEIDIVAQKAGDDELVKRLRENVNKFFILLEKDFLAKFDGIIEAYSSGMGSNSAFLQGAAAMEQLREELKDFVADAQTFGDLQIFHNRDLTPEQLAERVKEAERAAQQMVLATIAGVDQLSEMETAVLHLRGSAAAAQGTLEQLGMSAEDAAAGIEQALGSALAKLRDGFMKDITSSLNQLSGVGYLNDILDAQEIYQQRLKNSAALGIDGSYALRELSLSLKDIVLSSDLTKAEIEILSKAFPQLQFAIKGWSEDTLSLAGATSQLQAAYDKEADALNDVIGRTKAFISSIKQFREEMKLNDTSPLGPLERVNEAARQFRELAILAMTGDEDAIGQLTQISQEYLDEAQAYYTSSVKYFEIWKEVDRTLSQVQSASEGSLSEAEKQLKSLDASVAGILKVDESVLSVKDALAQYNTTLNASLDVLKDQIGMVGTNAITEAYHNTLGRDPEAAGLSYWQQQVKDGKSIDWVEAAIGDSREAKIRALYKSVMGRDVDAAGLKYWVGTNKSVSQIEADLKYAKSIGAFASGGFHVGGLRIVGERGPEIEATGPSRIWSAGETRALFQDKNGDLVDEVKGLRQDNAELRVAVRELAKAVAFAGTRQIEEQQKTNANLAEVSGDLKRANAR